MSTLLLLIHQLGHPDLGFAAAEVRSGLTLKEALQVGRTIDHIAHVSDWLVHNGPDIVTGRATPAFTEGVVFREPITVLERDLAKEIVEGTPKTAFLQEAVWAAELSRWQSGSQTRRV